MFTQNCFIRKNTPELRAKLEKLGIKKSKYSSVKVDTLSTDNEKYQTFKGLQIGIDCGTNENLFLAIAALRDDSDINQWFTDGKDWFFCQYLKVGMHYQDKPEILFDKWHKASVDELIEHFKQ